MVVQQRAQANLVVLARLERAQTTALQRDAIHERLRAIIASAMISDTVQPAGLVLDGTPYFIEQAGDTWRVSAVDVEGLVDIYLASPNILALLPFDALAFAAARDQVLAALPAGSRYPTLAQSLARFGVDAITKRALAGLVTQASTSAQINPDKAPDLIRRSAKALAPSNWLFGQTTRVHVTLEHIGLVAK